MTVHVAGTGIALRVTHDRHLTLTAPPGKIVVVRDAGEPYLRFANGAVYRNTLATATSLEQTGKPPSNPVGSSAPPHWQRVAAGRTWTWREFSAAPGLWHVVGTIDGKPFEAQGRLPPPSGRRWVTFVPIVLALIAVYAVRDLRRRRRERRSVTPSTPERAPPRDPFKPEKRG